MPNFLLARARRGFNSHFDALSSFHEFDIVSLTETWLHDGIFDEEILSNSSYSIFRRDRDSSTSHKKDGGGVLMAIGPKYPTIRRRDLETNIELLWVQIRLDKTRSAFLGTVYLPPDCKPSVVADLEESLEKVLRVAKPDDSIILFGDFNMADARWKSKSDKYAVCQNISSVSLKTSNFIDCINNCELRQHNTLPTCNDKPLDLVFSNDLPVSVSYTSNPMPTSSTHQALEIVVPLRSRTSYTCVERTTYNFKKADFDLIFRLLACLSWSNLEYFASVNDALSYFYDIIFAVIVHCVPTVKFNASKFPHWYNSELIAVIKEKERARKDYLASGRDRGSEAFTNFCALRADVKKLQKKCHADYVIQVSEDIKNNPKRFWSYVKSQKCSNSLPQVFVYKDILYSSLRDIATAFCQYFESVFVIPRDDLLPNCVFYDVPQFRLPKVSAEKMRAELLALDPHTSSGYDNVSALFLHRCADHLCFPLATIFNMSVSRGEYTSLLKKEQHCPYLQADGK